MNILFIHKELSLQFMPFDLIIMIYNKSINHLMKNYLNYKIFVYFFYLLFLFLYVFNNLSLKNYLNCCLKLFFSCLYFDPFALNRSYLFLYLNIFYFTWFLGTKSGKMTRFTASVAGQWATSNLIYFNRLLSMTLCCLGPLWNSTLSLISPKYYPSRLTKVMITYQVLL